MAIVFREASDPNSRNSDKNVSMCTDDLSSNDTHWVFDGIKNRSLPDRLEIVIRPSPGSETPNRWHVDSMFPHDKLYCTRNALPGNLALSTFNFNPITSYHLLKSM